MRRRRRLLACAITLVLVSLGGLGAMDQAGFGDSTGGIAVPPVYAPTGGGIAVPPVDAASVPFAVAASAMSRISTNLSARVR